ncbi:MAG: Lrp/AsnC ligand binding domain-containing protein [Ardenticatenaceae bacterium]|nr:Lrp/AsnC ligand binding domain-containing protein [Ardenticatenaceae bacterium]
MVNALVLINVERAAVSAVAQQLLELEGVTEVFSVAGRYDLVAILRVKTNEMIADLVTNKILAVDGITRTETLIAFKVFSKFDLERMFSIGADR